jgi:DNA-binding MarR family transcriptional regulator
MVPLFPKQATKRGRSRASRVGESLRRLVDLVSHRSGLALEAMSDAAVTLPQVLLLNHVERRGTVSPSELAESLHASLSAVSQMIDRLVQQGLLSRTEDPVDRRRKSLATTASARGFLRKLGAARSAEYDLGLAAVSPGLLAQLKDLIERVISELERSRIDDAKRDPRPSAEAR